VNGFFRWSCEWPTAVVVQFRVFLSFLFCVSPWCAVQLGALVPLCAPFSKAILTLIRIQCWGMCFAVLCMLCAAFRAFVLRVGLGVLVSAVALWDVSS